MKKMELYDGEVVDVYQTQDIQDNMPHLLRAEQIWHETWIAQGRRDEGSCCGGKGLSVEFVRPRQRYPREINVVSCNWVQGNVSASKSHGPALQYLKDNGINARYNDGWMD